MSGATPIRHAERPGERRGGPRSRDRLTRRAQQIIAAVLRRGDWALDATLGRGRDALFLARTVGPEGRVFGCDVQRRALDASAALLATGAPEVPVELIRTDHAELAGRLPPGTAGRIKGLMMNLGFLPGGPCSPATRTDTTLAALESLLPHLAPGGRATIVAYVGHPGGREEAEAVGAWLASRPTSLFRVFLDAAPESPRAAPRLYWVHREG
jgi:SAM-dependent methyltransferase